MRRIILYFHCFSLKILKLLVFNNIEGCGVESWRPLSKDTSFNVFIPVKIQIPVFLVIIPCNLICSDCYLKIL